MALRCVWQDCNGGSSGYATKIGNNWVKYSNLNAAQYLYPGSLSTSIYYYLPSAWMSNYPTGTVTVSGETKYVVPNCMYAYTTTQVPPCVACAPVAIALHQACAYKQRGV